MLSVPVSVRRAGALARRVVARRPWIYWLIVAGLAAWAATGVANHVGRLDAARSGWGATTPVLVATRALAPGEPLATAVTARDWPRALAPPQALAELPDGAVARQRIGAGDPVRPTDVAGGGPLALVPDGWVAVPVVESPASGALLGDRVRAVSEGVVVAAEAVVVGAVGVDVTLVAVPADDAALVAMASGARHLTLLRLP